MMQGIASTKSDVAAFAAVGEQNDSALADSEFEQIFQQQTYQQSARPTAEHHGVSAAKKENQANVSLERDPAKSVKSKSSALEESETKTISVTTAAKEAVEPQHKTNTIDDSLITEIPEAEQSSPEQLNTAGKTELVPETQSQDEKSAEDWLALVNQLQLLGTDGKVVAQQQNNSPELLTDNEIVADESNVLVLLNSLLNDQDLQSVLSNAGFLSLDDLKLKLNEFAAKAPAEFAALSAELKVDPSISKVMAYLATFEQSAKKLNVSETTSVSVPIKSVNTEIQLFAQDVTLLLANNQLSASEIKLVQQALGKAIDKSHSINPELVELVQAKLSSLGKDGPASKGKIQGTQTKDESKLQTVELSRLLAKINQVESTGSLNSELKTQIDVSTNELRSKTQANNEISVKDKVSPLAENIDLDGLLAPTLLSNEALTAAELNNNSKLSKAEKLDIIQSSSTNSDKLVTNKVATDSDLKALIALPKEKLDEALINIAQRIATLLADEAKAQQKNIDVPKLASDVVVANSSNGAKDILAALNAGVSEFKAQMAAGREPGIDLSAMVNQAIAKTSDADVSVQTGKSLEQTLSGLSQALSAAIQLEASSQQQHTLNTMDANLEKLSTQSEHLKIQTQSQVESKLDKAINLAKPEAHLQLAEKVRWMVNTNNLIAEIRLDPAELGSMQVKVALKAESASVSFVVQSHQTRDALESATPKLREMLAEKGIELGQSTVRQDSQPKQDNQGQAQQQAKANQRFMTDSNEGFNNDETSMAHQAVNHRQASGGIDYFV
jgi:flagellar hook-length control protein FliK